MLAVILILLAVIVLLMIIIWFYQRQVKNICRQLAFLKEHESNMLISSETEWGSIGDLKSGINELLEDGKEKRKQYRNKEKNIAEIYTNLSHDIRTPLTSLDGYFQLLRDSKDEEEKQRYINIIEERIGSLNSMLEELFTFTKLKSDAYELELSTCNLTKLLKESILSYYEEWTKKDIKPILSITDKPLLIRGNAVALQRAIQNVIKNVLEHGTDEIRILLQEMEGRAVLSISNQVINPDDIEIERVFERFYKADKARAKTSTGLGLSIARGFVEKMNGTVRAQLEEALFSIIMEFETEIEEV